MIDYADKGYILITEKQLLRDTVVFYVKCLVLQIVLMFPH